MLGEKLNVSTFFSFSSSSSSSVFIIDEDLSGG